MVFKSGDVGPFWMTPAEQQQMQHRTTMEGQRTQQLAKAELVQQLKAQGIIAKGNKAAIQAQTCEQNLPMEEMRQKTIKGWEGNQKDSCRCYGGKDGLM